MSSAAAAEVCRLFLEEALPKLDVVDYSRQVVADVPREKPYAVIHFRTGRKASQTPYVLNSDEEISPDPGANDHKRKVYQRRVGTLVVDIYAPGALDLAARIDMARQEVVPGAILRDGGVVLYQITDAVDLTELLDTIWDEAARVEFAVKYMQATESGYPIIETVTIEYEQARYEGDPDPRTATITAAL